MAIHASVTCGLPERPQCVLSSQLCLEAALTRRQRCNANACPRTAARDFFKGNQGQKKNLSSAKVSQGVNE